MWSGWDTAGDTWIGPFEPKPASMEQVSTLADAITRGGMNCAALEDARGAQWTKLIFNAATNPLGALTGLSHGRVCELPATRKLVSELVAEGVAVAEALGITLDSDPDALVDHAAEVAYDHKASMLQDVLAHRPTEVGCFERRGGAVRPRDRRADADERGDRGAHPRCREVVDGSARRGGVVSAPRQPSSAEVERRYANARAAMAENGADALLVAGSEYTGFEGAVRYMSWLPASCTATRTSCSTPKAIPVSVFPSEARWVGDHADGWVKEKVFVDHPGAWIRTTCASTASSGSPSTGSTT